MPYDLLTRRSFLRRAGLAVPALAAVGFPSGLAGAEPFPGMIIREQRPENLEFPFSALDGFLTPNGHFYVRSHFDVPKIDRAAWRLKVEGAVENPLELSFDDLQKFPQRKQTRLLECAGNGRVFLKPAVGGLQWGLGAVGNAEWGGVPLEAVLDKAGVKKGAAEVVLEGADRGPEPKSPGPIAFARSVPIEKATRGDVLLASTMNGADLPASHGFPLRAVVAGWYGMASVKWLTRVVVTDRPFRGYWQTFSYSYFERENGYPVVRPVTELLVKSSIARPALNEVVPAGQKYRVFGAAWAGDAEVRSVEVSDDGGKRWRAARLLGEPVAHSWRLWDFDWSAPAEKGPVRLMARATDSKGRTQPMERDPARLSYMINHVVPVEVLVR